MYGGCVVCERRSYGSVPAPELYSGRPLLTPCENPALRITRVWRVSFANKRFLAVNKLTTLWWRTHK